MAQDIDDGETDRSSANANRAKLWVLAEKTGMLGGKSLDMNDFLNYQIQQLYKKAEKQIKNNAKDLDILREKVEKLEVQNEDEDPEAAEREIILLNKAIEIRKKKIEEGKPPASWNPTSAKEAILSTLAFR